MSQKIGIMSVYSDSFALMKQSKMYFLFGLLVLFGLGMVLSGTQAFLNITSESRELILLSYVVWAILYLALSFMVTVGIHYFVSSLRGQENSLPKDWLKKTFATAGRLIVLFAGMYLAAKILLLMLLFAVAPVLEMVLPLGWTGIVVTMLQTFCLGWALVQWLFWVPGCVLDDFSDILVATNMARGHALRVLLSYVILFFSVLLALESYIVLGIDSMVFVLGLCSFLISLGLIGFVVFCVWYDKLFSLYEEAMATADLPSEDDSSNSALPRS